MDKRGAKILLSCVLCTIIVSVLFMFAFRITRLTCELVSVEPARLRAHQLETFDKKRSKPIRSHDKLLLIKLTGYLEYNNIEAAPAGGVGEVVAASDLVPAPARATTTSRPLGAPGLPVSSTPGPALGMAPPAPTPIGSSNQTVLAGASMAAPAATAGQPHPSPSQVQLAFSPQQLANSSFAHAHASGLNATSNRTSATTTTTTGGQQQQRRFLPLELHSVETRRVSGDLNKLRYILSFNCTKLNMVMVYQQGGVFVESMGLELKPASQQERACELELAPAPAANGRGGGPAAFAVNSAVGGSSNAGQLAGKSSDHLAHYFCTKPLSYACRPKGRPSGPALVQLHINAIEFETATLAAGNGERKHVKHEFKSKRSECLAN